MRRPRAVPAKEERTPTDVHMLILHAQKALAAGDIDRAESTLELAARRCEN